MRKQLSQLMCTPIGGLRHQRETRQVGEGVAIAERDRPPPRHPVVEHLQLPPSNASQQVTHAVVVAHLGVLIGQAGIARLGGPEPRFPHPLGIVRDQHAAAGRGDDLVAVEREGAHRGDGPGRTTAIQRPERLGGVLQQQHPVALAERHDRIHVRALPEQVNYHQGLGEPARPSPRRQRVLEHVGVDIPAGPLAVEEHRRAPEIGDRVNRGHEGQRRREDLVAGADPKEPKSQVQRGRAA